MRVFIAMPLPGEVISGIADWMEPLRKRHPALRWVDPGIIHLTLRFLGDVGEGEIGQSREILDRERIPPVEFTLDRTGTFGRGRNGLPGVYWIGGSFSPGVFDLARSLSVVKDSRGESGRAGKFRPHLTVARQGRYNERVQLPDPGPWKGVLDRVSILNSSLTVSGPVYSEIGSFRLSGG